MTSEPRNVRAERTAVDGHGERRSKHRRPPLERVARCRPARSPAAAAQSSRRWTVTCSASVASLPQLRASSRLEPEARRSAASVIWARSDGTDAVVEELGLHAGLVDEVLRRAAAEARPTRYADAGSPGWRFDNVAVTSIWPAVASRWRACDEPMPRRRSAIGQKMGTFALKAAVRIVWPVCFQRYSPSLRGTRAMYGGAAPASARARQSIRRCRGTRLTGVSVVDAIDAFDRRAASSACGDPGSDGGRAISWRS